MSNELTTQQMLDSLQVPAPKPPEKGLSALVALKAAGANAEDMKRFAENLLYAALPQIFEFIDEAHSFNNDALSGPSDIEGMSWMQFVARMEKLLEILDNHKLPKIRRAVHLARVRRWLKPDMDDETQVLAAWRKIVEAKYLCEMENGQIPFGTQRFGVSIRFCFEEPDINEIARHSRTIADKVYKSFGELLTTPELDCEKPALKPAPTPRPVLKKVSAAEVWKKRAAGKFELVVSNGNNGHARKIVLAMESQPTAGNGPVLVITDPGASAFRGGESILLSAIQDESGEFRDGLKVAVDPSSPNASEKMRVLESIGKMLKTGFRTVLEAEEREIDAANFLCGDIGQSDIAFPERFEWNPPDGSEQQVFDGLTLRWARNIEGKVALLKIVSGGKKAELLFGENIGEFQEPGQAFLGVKPLASRNFLKACFKKLVLEKTGSRSE